MGWRRFNATAEPVYRQEPISRYTSLETEAWVPMAQAGIISIAWAFVAAMGAGLLTGWRGWPWWVVPSTGVVVAVSLFAVQVTRLIGERRDLLWRREEIEGRDINGDGWIGAPPPTTRVELVDQENKRIRYVDIPLSDGELARLARAVLIQRVEWSRRNLADAGALIEDKYTAVIEPMLAGGLLAYRGTGPTSGIEVTATGRAFLRQYQDG